MSLIDSLNRESSKLQGGTIAVGVFLEVSVARGVDDINPGEFVANANARAPFHQVVNANVRDPFRLVANAIATEVAED